MLEMYELTNKRGFVEALLGRKVGVRRAKHEAERLSWTHLEMGQVLRKQRWRW